MKLSSEPDLQSIATLQSQNASECAQNDFNKSIEFKDLVYAVFQGRGLGKKYSFFNF